MKCPKCGADCSVLETRSPNSYTTKRRYECERLHRFSTLEVLPSGVSTRDQKASVRAGVLAAAKWKRNEAIYEARMAGVPALQLAHRYHLTDARVRQIIDTIKTQRKQHDEPTNARVRAESAGGKSSSATLFNVWGRKGGAG